MTKLKFFGACAALALTAVQSFAVPPKTWDAIFNAEGQGEYASVTIDGNIRFGQYTHYKQVLPISFRIKDGKFDFSVAGNMKVPANLIEKENFLKKCAESKEAWVSYFDKVRTMGEEQLIIYIGGVDFACENDLFAISDLRLRFSNPVAQKAWSLEYETRHKAKRDQLAEFRVAEQEHRMDIRDKSGMFTDPRDGQVYRTIKVEGREWFAQNVNYDIPGHSWCYEDKDSYCSRSGRLYDLDGARQACPEGWHLPRDREWSDMLKGLTGCYDGVDKCGNFATKMKATTGWRGGGGTDEYGFTVFSSGYRKVLGKTMVRYEDMGEYAGFWSAQNGRNETIWLWSMGRMSDQMVRQLVPTSSKNNGYSVRCINGN